MITILSLQPEIDKTRALLEAHRATHTVQEFREMMSGIRLCGLCEGYVYILTEQHKLSGVTFVFDEKEFKELAGDGSVTDDQESGGK